jgi:hypothetical protein
VTAPTTRLLCTPWAALPDLPATKPTLDDATWDDLLWTASEMLYLWSGKQFSGDCVSTVVLETPPGAIGSACWRHWGNPWTLRGQWDTRESVVARLPGAPVTSIESVTIDDVVQVADVDYIAELPAGLIWRTQFRHWSDDGTTRITYHHGIAPPIGGKRSAVLLAIELGKSWSGEPCNLPKRLTSVTREGVTMTMATTLNGWRTGLWDVDAWLASVNPHMATRRASAWSPDVRHARRTIT